MKTHTGVLQAAIRLYLAKPATNRRKTHNPKAPTLRQIKRATDALLRAAAKNRRHKHQWSLSASTSLVRVCAWCDREQWTTYAKGL